MQLTIGRIGRFVTMSVQSAGVAVQLAQAGLGAPLEREHDGWGMTVERRRCSRCMQAAVAGLEESGLG